MVRNEISQEFAPDERLLRAVWPPSRRPNFWRGNRLSSAAFKDKRGLSVSRTAFRTMEASVQDMRSRFQGMIVSVQVEDCRTVQAVLRYCPSRDNPYHSEIHGSKTEKLLSDAQALYLATKARME